ncbi:MAG: hypothetical protein ACYSWP_07450 [Planctomycetota bacterium]|jgi:hypothetical protein
MDTENQVSLIYEDLLFLRVFKAFRIAIQPGKMFIALLALSVIGLAGFLMDYSRTVVVTHNANGVVVDTELDQYVLQRYGLYINTQAQDGQREGVYSTLWHFARKRFHNSLKSLFDFNFSKIVSNAAECVKACDWAFRYHPVYCIIFSLMNLAVISITGGAICRIAALQFAQGEKPGISEALQFSTKRFLSFFTAPLIPLAIIGIVGGFVILLGLAGNIPWGVGEILMGVFACLAFILGAIVAVLLIGAVAGFNLMFPAVAYDGSDCFDAMCRSFMYIYSRPWRMGFYSSITAVYGAFCYLFVRFFAFLILTATYIALDIGIYKKMDGITNLQRIWARPDFLNLLGTDQVVLDNGAQIFAGWVIYLLVLLVIGLVVAFIVSFYFSANTIIYALLRNRVDHTAIEDVYTQLEQAEVDTFAYDTDKADDSQSTEDEESAE